MKKKVAMKWVEALRSGKYEQGTNALQNKNKYCCLGVLCDISNEGKWDCGGYITSSITAFGILPPEVQKWSGMQSREGMYRSENGTKSLADYNDGLYGNSKQSFEQIANWIEKHYKVL